MSVLLLIYWKLISEIGKRRNWYYIIWKNFKIDEIDSQDPQGWNDPHRDRLRSNCTITIIQVLNLKEKIFEAKALEVDTQKIVFKGKATNNTDVLSNIGVKDNDFLVVMTMIKKPEPKKVEKVE